MKKKDLLWVLEVDEARQKLDKAVLMIGAECQDSGVFRTLYGAYDILKRESPYYTDEREVDFKERNRLDEEFFDLLHSKMSKKKKLEALLRKPEGDGEE